MATRRSLLYTVLGLALCLLSGRGAAAGEFPKSQASVLAVLERALTPEQMWEVEFLRHLGWRLQVDPTVSALTVDGGHPGRFKNLAAVHAAGGLRIRVPASFDEAQARAAAPQLTTLADSIASRLAYRHKLVAPVQRATKRLAAMTEAGRYVFPEIFELFHSPRFILKMPLTEWTLRDRMFFATRSPTPAMEAFFRLGATAECYVGQMLAVYAVQYELLGRDWFDRIMTAEEMVVGRPKEVIKTPLMKNMEFEVPYDWRALIVDKPNQFKDAILTLAPHGPIAFTGLGGVVLNQSESCFTQDNLIVISITQRALDEYARGGGSKYFDQEAVRIWEHAKKGKAGNLDLGVISLGGLSDEAEKKIDEILARPMFSEVQVYVHPDGIVPLSFTVKKFIDRTDSPVTLRINMNGLDDDLYQRYRKAFLEGCMVKNRSTAPEIAGD